MSIERICSDCGNPMVEGFILDLTYGGSVVPRWLKGTPETSFWTGVKATGKECRSVETYRCINCGLLRSYALDEVDPQGIWGN